VTHADLSARRDQARRKKRRERLFARLRKAASAEPTPQPKNRAHVVNLMRPRRRPAAIGDVRVVRGHSGQLVRRVKFTNVGRSGQRWMDYARWWWLRHKSPIPAGMGVTHANGHLLDDRPQNLVLTSSSDRLARWHLADGRRSRAQLRRAWRGCAESNRARAEVRSLRTLWPTRWYVVDPAARTIETKTWRRREDAYRAAGVDVDRRHVYGPPRLGGVYGFPGLSTAEGATLRAIVAAAGRGLLLEELRRAVPELIAERRAYMRPRQSVYSEHVVYRLRRMGLVKGHRTYCRGPVRYVATRAALAREKWEFRKWVLTGVQLRTAEFAGWERVRAGGRYYATEDPRDKELLELLEGAG